MKIKTLKIDGYKNLQETILIHDADLITIIGNNGSGKSNLLEAISIIFRNLYTLQQDMDFAFMLEYSNTKGESIKIEKESKKRNSNIQFLVDGKSVIKTRNYLPKKVIAIYSGDEDRLWRWCYSPFYNEFVNNTNKARTQGTQFGYPLPPMLYINKQMWDISLLCLALSDLEDNKNFLEEVLKLPEIQEVHIYHTGVDFEKFQGNLIVDFLKKIQREGRYEFSEIRNIVESGFYAIDDVFKYLFISLQAGLLQDVKVVFKNDLTLEHLSEGEKKLLLVKASLEFAEQEDSMFLLDEPDAHIHVNNKDKIIQALESYRGNRQIIVTTHSPTITQCVDENSLFMMVDGKFVPRNQQEIINDITGDFWSLHQQNNFLSSKKDTILLVEGKHDKEHILNAFQKLKDQYPTLKFDIFSFGGESKIQPFMQGLYEAGSFADKTYIAIYDNDKAGSTSYGKGFDKEENNCGYKKLHKDKLEHNNFFAFLLPKPNNYNQDCTIENMFACEKYRDAYKQALEQTHDYFGNKSIDDINQDIKEKSKNILASNSKRFLKEDFEHFKPLFNLILRIKENNQITTVVSPILKVGDKKDVVQKKISNTEKHHLKYWESLVEMSKNKSTSYKYRNPRAQHWMDIALGKSDFFIRITNDTRNSKIGVQLICIGKENFKKLRKLCEIDSKQEIDKNLEWLEKDTTKEHHVNLYKTETNPLNEEDWDNQHLWFIEVIEKFYCFFKDKIQLV